MVLQMMMMVMLLLLLQLLMIHNTVAGAASASTDGTTNDAADTAKDAVTAAIVVPRAEWYSQKTSHVGAVGWWWRCRTSHPSRLPVTVQ
uniref:Putative secreted protein n=1 Tax=Anopheles marajoara TaxID=58244 RepID=A0A2M4CA66_9DIPT